MSKLSITLAICAVALLGTAACEDAQVKDAAEDVKDAKQDVKEEKQELAEEKAEFSAELRQRVAAAEERYATLARRATTVKAGVAGTPTETSINQAMQLATTQIEQLRKATPTTVERDLEQLNDAMDRLDELLDEYDSEAM